MKKVLFISSIVLLIDQFLKFIASSFIQYGKNITIISNFFDLMHLKNYGAAFSIFEGGRLLFIIISIGSLILIYQFLLKNKNLKKLEIIIYGFLIGGLLGNLFDRVIFGYVIDYLSFKIFNYNFPVFNFADICIVLSTISLVFIIGSEKNENSRK